MDIYNTYHIAIAISMVVVLSFIFNQIAKRTRIPSVLMLIGLGVACQYALKALEVDLTAYLQMALEFLGIVGLIMIVLEAALDLKLTREHRPLLGKALLVALLALIVTSVLVAALLTHFSEMPQANAIYYAVPLSILSSAIIIPSVANLSGHKKEFLVYESTLSDILGIMMFYFVTENTGAIHWQAILEELAFGVLGTILVAILVGLGLVLLLQRIQAKVKLFFLIALLIMIYSGGKLLHLSSLLLILVFGLILSNPNLVFRGKMKRWVHPASLKDITDDFHVLTLETAFVVRTFFFVVFGMTLDFSGLADPQVLLLGGLILAAIYGVRVIMLRVISGKNILPQLWIAPRGLITILLFFSIPSHLIWPEFNPAILLVVILGSSLIMTFGMLFDGPEQAPDVERLQFPTITEIDQQMLSGGEGEEQEQ